MNLMALDENVHHLCVYLPKYKTIFLLIFIFIEKCKYKYNNYNF